ncbi:MAG: hypothetical protein M3Y87_34120 [Myxococcota bacterium]|nr:hypothetical protein [Myxococcota bacterium]
MTVLKIAVSLPPQAVAHARAAVKEGRAKSLSAYVAAAMEEKAKMEDLGTLLDEMLAATGGPMSASERREMDRLFELGRATTKRRSRRR